jgi:hypothetical protein
MFLFRHLFDLKKSSDLVDLNRKYHLVKLAGVDARDIFVDADRERLIASFLTSLAEFLSATFVGLMTELLGKSQCVLSRVQKETLDFSRRMSSGTAPDRHSSRTHLR